MIVPISLVAFLNLCELTACGRGTGIGFKMDGTALVTALTAVTLLLVNVLTCPNTALIVLCWFYM